MALFELLLFERPLSIRVSERARYRAWKELIRVEARRRWTGEPIRGPRRGSSAGGLRLTLVFLSREALIDVDNIIKPIQDALTGVVYVDDRVVTDVDSHRRFVNDLFDIERAPPLLVPAMITQRECIYIRVAQALALETYL